jgi:ribosomal protein L11 methyltransferase
VLRVPESAEDALAGSLSEGALGLESSFDAPGRLRLRVFFESVARAAEALPAAAARLRALALDPARCRLSVEPVADGRWAERWQEGLRPFPLGERFVVHPSGSPPESRGERTPILLVPGRAFGTGEHGTTRLAVEALERQVTPGEVWLDLGTGTGLLALVAHHLGAGGVFARDDDPDAVEVAREVLEANGAAGAIALALGSIAGLAPASFDGVVANIVAPFFLEHAEEVCALLRPGGILLATGILEEEAGPVEVSLARAGLAPASRHDAPPWTLIAARRTA